MEIIIKQIMGKVTIIMFIDNLHSVHVGIHDYFRVTREYSVLCTERCMDLAGAEY